MPMRNTDNTDGTASNESRSRFYWAAKAVWWTVLAVLITGGVLAAPTGATPYQQPHTGTDLLVSSSAPAEISLENALQYSNRGADHRLTTSLALSRPSSTINVAQSPPQDYQPPLVPTWLRSDRQALKPVPQRQSPSAAAIPGADPPSAGEDPASRPAAAELYPEPVTQTLVQMNTTSNWNNTSTESLQGSTL